MSKETTVTVKGSSQAAYSFDVYPWGTNFKALGAVYLILKKTPTGTWVIIYIGQTEDLSCRFSDHHKQACFECHGRTHIGVLIESFENKQLAVEADLIASYPTMCNG